MSYQLHTPNIWFPDQREPVYDPQDEQAMVVFKEYWKKEKDRCMHGFAIDGVRIPGRLYFHTVYWKIAAYVEKKTTKGTKKVREIITPLLRDLDWDIFNDLEDCSEEGKFYSLVGSRDFGKSIIAASCAGWQYTFFSKSESVISGGAANYIKLASDKIEDGLLNLHPIFKKQRLSSDWKKEILAGWKDKKTNLPDVASSFSSIKIRNYENGNNTMAANGTRPGFHLIDEIGTIPNLIGCVKDSDGCWWSGGGDKPSCLVMLAGTGGDMEVGAEAGEIFFNADAYNMLSFENPEIPGTRMGRFISALRAKLAFKKEQTLAEYLGIEGEGLSKVKILVSDEEAAKLEWWDREYAKAIKSGNSKTVLKFKAYWPLVASDSFLVLTKNDYNIDAARQQQQRLRSINAKSTNIELYHDGEKICHKFSDKLPITEFPVKTQSKDAPIQMWEPPMQNPPFGLYVAGVDNYRQGKSEYSDSLGVVYIFKRMHDIKSESYQDMIVASYAARPDNPDFWNEQARMLIKYYNARTLAENDDMTFINYMIAKGDGHYLEDQPQWLRMYVPTSRVDREKGIHRSSEKIRDMLRAGSKRYLDDVLKIERDEAGSVVKEILGVSRVLDPMLLEEIIKYNEDGNFDREVAFSLAIALANHLTPILGKVSDLEKDPRFKSLYKSKKTSALFSSDIKRNKAKLKLFSRI
jgi:hypothetical protein